MNYVISTNMPTLSRLLLQFIKKKEEKIIRLTLLVMNDKVYTTTTTDILPRNPTACERAA